MTGCSRAGREASGQEGVVCRARRDVSERGGMCLGGAGCARAGDGGLRID